MKCFTKLTFAILPLTLLAACASTPDEQAASSDTGAQTQPMTSGGGAQSMGADGSGGTQMNPLNDPNSLLSKRVIYFDFDKADIRPEFRDIVQAHAAYLGQNANVSVTLEGHADERGSREYNIGLGERRAIAVKNVLTLQGAGSSQVETVSYGEERPVAMGHDEQSWGLNRRVEIVYR
ncbi:MAG: peptidoglycan-associated lipoprotein Pal [Gammaproteobacteria bacterium]|nr:peptidoglycan-associated lipoprotein Pal [Gammaproteobacteria bacterium]